MKTGFKDTSYKVFPPTGHGMGIAEFDGLMFRPFNEVAAHDGLSEINFVDWFFRADPMESIRADIIHFTDFRYAKVGAK